jgi:hypothetical protein
MGRFLEMWRKLFDRTSKSSGESYFDEELFSNPAELLFSMASISDQCPFDPLAARADEAMPSINEDDWLQIEFLPISETDAVNNEFSKLFEHIASYSNGSGFSEIYLRQSKTHLPLLDFAIDLRPYWNKRTPLAVGGHHAPLVFHVEFTCGWRLYALENSRRAILKLGIQHRNGRASEEFLRSVQDCCAKQSLLLVDWEQIKVVDTNSLAALRDWTNFR